MLKSKQRPATYADIEVLPPHVVGEIVHGVLHTHPRPAPRHQRASGRLQSVLMYPFDFGKGGPGGWIFLDEPELHLGNHIVVPDIAGWRAERLTPFPDTAYIATPPDWLCEVLSPSTHAIDRTDKLSIYAEFGVQHCWYVDPIAQTLEVLALTNGKWLLHSAYKKSDSITAPPFEAHTFTLDVLWAGT